jgi:RNA recognition motif-containing protein
MTSEKNIFVGNLPYATNEETLRALFESIGPVASARIILDRESHRPRGFGFVEMQNPDDVERAIAHLAGIRLEGRELVVNQARPAGGRAGWT